MCRPAASRAARLTATGINGLLPQVRQVYTGFVAGYNRFLRSGKLRDPACKGKPWVTPITLTDMVLRGEQIVTEGSAQQFISDLDLAAPPPLAAQRAAAGTAAPPGGDHRAELRRPARPVRRPGRPRPRLQRHRHRRAGHPLRSRHRARQSALSLARHRALLDGPARRARDSTTSRAARSWASRSSASASTGTSPGLTPSRPRGGLSSTASRSSPGIRPATTSTASRCPWATSPSRSTTAAQTVTHTFYTTRWGLVLNVTAVPGGAYGWSATTAYALYDAVGSAGPRAADQYLRMGQATSVRDLFNVEAHFLAIPTFNTIAADDHGNAYYGDVGATPARQPGRDQPLPAHGHLRRSSSRRLAWSPSTARRPRVRRQPSRTRRRPACSTPPTCRTPSGATTWRTPTTPTGWPTPTIRSPPYSPIIGLTRTVQGLRTRIGNQMIAGSGQGHRPPRAGQVHPRHPAAHVGERPLRAGRARPARPRRRLPRASLSERPSNGQLVDLTAACAALAGWDGTGHLKARGGWLFTVWNFLDTDSSFYTTAFDPGHPLSTPSGLNTGPDGDAAEVAGRRRAQPPRPRPGPERQLRAGPARAAVAHDPDPRLRHRVLQRDLLADRHAGMNTPEDAAPYGQVYDGSSLVMTTLLTPERPRVPGHPHLLAGHRSHIAVVLEHDQAVLAPEVGPAALHRGRAGGQSSALGAPPGLTPGRSPGRDAPIRAGALGLRIATGQSGRDAQILDRCGRSERLDRASRPCPAPARRTSRLTGGQTLSAAARHPRAPRRRRAHPPPRARRPRRCAGSRAPARRRPAPPIASPRAAPARAELPSR